MKFRLGAHPNTYNTAIVILESHGYTIDVSGELDEDEAIITSTLSWSAENKDLLIYAENPLELLGLLFIYKDINPSSPTSNWWIKDDDRIDEIIDMAFPD